MPATHTTVIFAVIANHEHDFPFEHVIRNEANGYSWYGVFGSLHGFELARKEAGGGGRGHGFFLFFLFFFGGMFCCVRGWDFVR